MTRGEPPDEQFQLLLPPAIKGFNLRRKKWYDLVADRITEVKWNKEAFQKFVMDRMAKDLIWAIDPISVFEYWKTFFDRLGKIKDDGIDIEDLCDQLDDLKEEEMNGRQIRNVIPTVRQYSKWKKTTLTYAHLKDVVEVARRFDKYLNRLHGGLTAD
ncbi:Fc.00g026490.m01.CDS01 [Cosmosporella sp. VM-42]